MNDEKYLLDNNTLSHMTRQQIASEFFLEQCRIPTEVLYEARQHPEAAAFNDIEYPTTPGVLQQLAHVMESVAVDDTSLVDLYANKGAADPLLVACALDGTVDEARYLWGTIWVVVSNDKAVRAAARANNLESLTREEFFAKTEEDWMR
ncbi:hypothetical protein [Brachybacterium hainanense]|uniref:PIN domain-containing protein n=1 Tax=Brachybacterium hainanense TaxID=1541174 RepID=A0ABV6RDW1_9MICO